LNVRKDKWFAAPWQSDKRMGASKLQEWQNQVRFTGLEHAITDASTVFTNELIDEINAFDSKAVEEQTRSLKL
jgi:NitT/TauT family transport system substrate-binding protein